MLLFAGMAPAQEKELPPPTPVEPAAPLTLREVLDSVERHYPLLQAAVLDRRVADGKVISANSPFDLGVTGTNNNQPGSTFPDYRGDAGLRQLSPYNGAEWTAGYRYGYGDYPSYEGGYKSADGGEFRAGLRMPLLRGREIDERRANLYQAEIDREAVEPSIVRRKIGFDLRATRSYWLWVAEGHRLRMAEELLRVAEERDEQFTKRLEAGRISQFQRDDNRRTVYDRAGLLAAANGAFRQAAIGLSLYLRDDSGRPRMPPVGRTPTFPPPAKPETADLDTAVRLALQRRPEFRELALQRERVAVELRQAENLLLPAADLVLTGAQDIGGTTLGSSPDKTDRTKFDVGIRIDFPYQRSEARGRVLTARTRLAQIDAEMRFAADSIGVDVRAAWTDMARDYEVYRQARKEVDLNRKLAEGEREKFEGGNSTVFMVNLREQAAFEAELKAIAALLDYFQSLAEFRAAVGLGQLGDRP